MTLKRINSFRWMLAILVIGAILACSINTASAASPLNSNRFAKSMEQHVSTAFIGSDRNGQKSKGQSKSNRGASKRANQSKKAASSSRGAGQRKKAPSASRKASQRKKAPSANRSASQRKKATSSNRNASQRKKAPNSSRSASQRKKTPSASRSASQRKKAPSSSRSASQRKKSASSNRSVNQRGKASRSNRGVADQRRRASEANKKTSSAKRQASTNRQRRDAKRNTPQRYRRSNSHKPSVSKSPRVTNRTSAKPSGNDRYSSYPRRSQESPKNDTNSLDRSRLSRTGKFPGNNRDSKSVSKVSAWRKGLGKDNSTFNKRYKKNKNRSQLFLDRRSRFDSPGAGDIFYDPPSSPIEKVIYDNNYYNNTYYNYNNYYDHGDYYDHGYSHLTWYGGHHNSHLRHSWYGHSFGFWFNFNFHSGYRHHYYYPHWSYVDYYYYEPYYPSHSFATVYYEPVTQITYEPLLPSIDEAWELLANGAFEEALGVFAELVYELPFEAAPRIGYAIASGMLYRNGAAISAMRRAMIDDPQALLDVPIEPLITEHYQWLLEHYSDRVREDTEDIDGLFMVAAMRFILEEPTQAYFAIDLAIRRGDENQSAENLKALISDVIEQGF